MCFISLISVAYVSYDHLYPKQLTQEDQIKQDSSNVPNLRTKAAKREMMKKHDLPTDSLYNLQFPSIDGDMVQLSRFAGHSAVVINVASEWGKTDLTYRHIGLMLNKYSTSREEGNDLVILAFPTNDFRQEPGTNDEIKKKVIKLLGKDLYDDPNFVLFQKSSLRENPVYEKLQRLMPNKHVKHNFFKYLLDKDGLPLSFHTKKQTLFEMEGDIDIATSSSRK